MTVDYRWYDGYSPWNTDVYTYKIEWTIPDGSAAGWFLLYSKFEVNSGAYRIAPPTGQTSVGPHTSEDPVASQVIATLRRITGRDDAAANWTITEVEVTPAVVVTP